jgi:hypothetical protein
MKKENLIQEKSFAFAIKSALADAEKLCKIPTKIQLALKNRNF